MNTTIHNVPTQQAQYIPSQGVPILERPQGYPEGYGQGHPTESLETTKDVRWSSHGVYYGTPQWRQWKHWDIRITPTPEMLMQRERIQRTMNYRLMMSFIYVWCMIVILFGIFYYANSIRRSTFLFGIVIVTLVLLVSYMYSHRPLYTRM